MVISLFYKAHYSHLLQVEASNPASMFPFNMKPEHIDQIVKQILTLHPELQRFELRGQHYAMVANHFMHRYLADVSRKYV